ncbi:hypothetical protein [Knoellia subterranea]|uniref:Uncharacterized protein n=1 Tax=Knoellia subterranea KCTC 19937 TaxID=1385521 RepID=A0A0A0JQX4_9MICO|nr:hypothetical protein [Knoellia subterranea]KGN39573.1 hypothetical protein N803_01265 [Knoellia subterranea KCTC 19937]
MTSPSSSTSRSQRGLRAAMVVASIGLTVLAAVASSEGVFSQGTVVGTLVVLAATPWAVVAPASRLPAVLMGLHCLNWLANVAVPTGAGEWGLIVVAAIALLTIHLAAALSSALPPAAHLPSATLRRWLRRSLTVVGLSIPVWAVLAAESARPPAGVPLITYAAVAALAILSLAVWLGQQPNRSQPAMAPNASAGVSSSGISSRTDRSDRSS